MNRTRHRFNVIFWASPAAADCRAQAQAKSHLSTLRLHSASHQEFILKPLTPLMEVSPLGSTWHRIDQPRFPWSNFLGHWCPLGKLRIQTCHHRKTLKTRNSRVSVPPPSPQIHEQKPTPQFSGTESWKPQSSCFGWGSPLVSLQIPRLCSLFGVGWAWAVCLYSAPHSAHRASSAVITPIPNSSLKEYHFPSTAHYLCFCFPGTAQLIPEGVPRVLVAPGAAPGAH